MGDTIHSILNNQIITEMKGADLLFWTCLKCFVGCSLNIGFLVSKHPGFIRSYYPTNDNFLRNEVYFLSHYETFKTCLPAISLDCCSMPLHPCTFHVSAPAAEMFADVSM